MIRSFFFIIILVCSFKQFYAQDSKIDSLQSLVKNAKEDTNKVILLNKLSGLFQGAGDYSVAIANSQKSADLAIKLNYKKGLVTAYNAIGISHSLSGNFKESLQFFFESLRVNREIGNKHSIATSLNNIGNVYYYTGNYSEALNYYLKSLKIEEEINNKEGLANAIGNIALVYEYQKDLDKAIEYNLKAIALSKTLNDKAGLASNYLNIGNVYATKKQLKTAQEYYLQALDLFKQADDPYGTANAYIGIGNILQEENKFNEALGYYFKSLEINTAIDNKTGQCFSKGNIGKIYCQLGDFKKGLFYLNENLRISVEIGSLEAIQSGHEFLSQAYTQMKQYDKALEHHKLYIVFRDSIYNEENTKKQIQSQMSFEFEKKEQHLKSEQEKKETLHQAELNQQTMQRNGFIAGFGLMVALAGVSYRSYRNKRKAHTAIAHQKELVEEKNRIVEEKNKDILDSINYARRIQEALLKEEEHVSKHLPEHFILFKPKDIVSGDFYWNLEKHGYLYLAAVDCTGHGVPGAFMSMLGIAFLNEITASERALNPAEILDRLRDKVIKELSQTGKEGESKDGMDISLVRLNLATKELEWAGANNSIYIINGVTGNLSEVKPDKQPIGYHMERHPFTLRQIQLNAGDVIYIFTDGYADQFGGDKGKKFKYSQFKTVLQDNFRKPLSEQKTLLNGGFETWKGKLEQVDDVCVIGVRL